MISRALSPRHVVETMGPAHPVTRSLIVLRCWLLLVVVMLIWNSFVANGILLGGWLRPLPFLFLAASTILWFVAPWKSRLVIAGASLIGVGLFLRGMEVVLFSSDVYDLRTRFTAASVWWTVAGTSVLVGVLNLVVTSKRTAEEWVWDRRD